MIYKVVKPGRRKRVFFEVLRDLGECASLEAALEKAHIWLRHVNRQRLFGYEEDISNAVTRLEAKFSLDPIGAPLYPERQELPKETLFLQDEEGVLYNL